MGALTRRKGATRGSSKKSVGAVVAPAVRTVQLSPAATAMVWLGPGKPHEQTAFPGVPLGVGEVLVAIELATICGSDVHTVRGDRSAPAPSILGHEQVGRVVALGPTSVDATDGLPLSVGDRVVWSITVSCGECDRCARGLTQKCRSLAKYGHERIAPRWELTGGFASHAHLRAGTAIVRVSADVPAEVLAPVSCGTATAWAALEQAARAVDLEGAVVLISGAGLIGLTAAAMASDRGASVVVVDPDPARRALALRFGADETADPASGPAGLRAALVAAGRAAGRGSGRSFGTGTGKASGSVDVGEADVVIEASGSWRAVASGLDLVATGGVVVLVGSVSPSESVALDPERIVRGLITIRGVHNYTAPDLTAAVAFVTARSDEYPFAALVGATVSLARLDEGIALAGPGGPVRVAVTPV